VNPISLTDTERTAIIGFCSNTTAFEAVKKVVLSALNITLADIRTEALTTPNSDNSSLGEAVRAHAQAADLVEEGFSRLQQVRDKDQPRVSTNPAL
jgi:hypothetical protein